MEKQKITIEELIAKYPKIFKDYEGNPGRVNWSGVPKGWLPIIDDLCGAMQDYIDTTTRFKDNPDYVPGSTYDQNDITTHKTINYRIPQVTCTQMKEKFGGLRFYTNGGDKITEGMISMAEYLCDNTCEVCGTREELGHTTGWITVCCKTCHDSGKSARGDWKAKK